MPKGRGCRLGSLRKNCRAVESEIFCRCMKNQPPLEEKKREKDDECWPFLCVTAAFGVSSVQSARHLQYKCSIAVSNGGPGLH